MTFFETFEFHIWWPILVMYFVVLVWFMLWSRIRHMNKHRYNPFNIVSKS